MAQAAAVGRPRRAQDVARARDRHEQPAALQAARGLARPGGSQAPAGAVAGDDPRPRRPPGAQHGVPAHHGVVADPARAGCGRCRHPPLLPRAPRGRLPRARPRHPPRAGGAAAPPGGDERRRPGPHRGNGGDGGGAAGGGHRPARPRAAGLPRVPGCEPAHGRAARGVPLPAPRGGGGRGGGGGCHGYRGEGAAAALLRLRPPAGRTRA
mmetsp:Transcript_70482/g.223291  ORF Transcript_70482/g.223291 Transcript_70482/m.223291 type:complete len:210 (+) Transcript_70482:342-971(+)